MWIGTTFNVLKFESAQDEMLPFYQLENDLHSDDNFFFRSMQDSSGGLWFRMMINNLVYCSALEEEAIITLAPPKNAFIEEIKHFCTDTDGNVWVITLTNGLYKFPKGKTIYQKIPLGDSILTSNPASIIADRKDKDLIWVTSKYGLCSINRFTYEEKWYHPIDDIPELNENRILEIIQDENGTIWFTMFQNEKVYIISFDPVINRFSSFSITKIDPKHRPANAVKQVSPHSIWFGTRSGLMTVDTRSKQIEFHHSNNGFPTGKVLSIEPEGNGNVWFTSTNKICKYDGEKFECFNPNPKINKFIYTLSLIHI